MDATESAALEQLGERDEWPVDKLPDEIDADVLRCLDLDELIEACWVVLVNQQKQPSDRTPPAPSRGRWFSPIKQPEMAGGWDRIRSAPPLGTNPRKPAHVDVNEVPIDDLGGFFPKRSHRIVSLSVPKQDPSFYVRLNERGRAELARMRRRPIQQTLADADSGRHRTNPSEQLRQFGIDCAAIVTADAPSWASAATWLQTLPICWAIVERHHGVDSTEEEGEPYLIVGLDGKPVDTALPSSHQFDIYNNEAEANRLQGPILRRLLNGWNAATHRFLHQQRGDDWLYDFGIEDARRIALLTALSFNRDFDGAVIGLNWEWEHPPDCKASFEGRGWTWASITSGLFAEETLVEVIGTAIDYLGRVTPAMSPRQPDLRPANEPEPKPTAMGTREVQRRLLEMCDTGEPYTTVRDLKKLTGCGSTSTVSKAINGSQTLQEWRDRHSNRRRRPRASSLTEVVTDNTPQTTEANPSDVLTDDEVDAVMARLIDEAQEQGKTGEVARLHTMDAEQRRAMAETYYAHNLDQEPSPLESEPIGARSTGVRQHKSV